MPEFHAGKLIAKNDDCKHIIRFPRLTDSCDKAGVNGGRPATTTKNKNIMNTKNLFTPLELGPLTLSNRILMPPLTRMRARMPGNLPWELNAEYYRQRAAAGLIITEGTPVSPRGHGYYHTPGIHTEAQAEGWKLVTAAVHEAGGRIFLQLWHVGRQSHNDLQPGGEAPVAPSAIAGIGQAHVAPGAQKDYPLPRALTTREIAATVEEFRRGAELAKGADFDGVELHGANGYLIEQFLSDNSNHRTDQYGGSLANRARFLLEVTEAVASVWQPARVGVRLSPANTYGGSAPSDRWGTYSHVVRELNRFGLAYLHFVEPRVAGNQDLRHFDDALSSRHFQPLVAGETKLISAGGHTFESGQAAVASGEADAVAFGRAFIANPDLPQRLATGAPLNRYQRETFYGGAEAGYTDYPALQPAGATALA
jgi:N-ethylmaleimide reductase